MLTHHNVLYEALSTLEAAGLGEPQRQVSYLPLAHIAERVLGLYGPQVVSGHVHCIGDPAQLLATLGEVHPTAFFGVPRVWEKIKTGLSAKLAADPNPDNVKLVQDSMAAALAWVQAQEVGGTMTPEIQAAYDEAEAAILGFLKLLLGLDQVTWAGLRGGADAARGRQVHGRARPHGLRRLRHDRGTVVAVDAAVTDLAIGDRVFGMPAYPRQAAGYADYVVARREDLAPTPANLDDVHAAALPLAGLTAHAAILGTGVAGPGRRVLVQAAGGGVGHIAVQLAKAVGAHVVATASPRKVDFVRALGADEVIDYTTGDWTTIDRVDLAVDPFAGENLHRTIGVVRDSGTVATLIGEADDDARAAAAERRITIDRVNVRPNADALGHLVSLVEEGRLAPHVSATFSLEQAGEAHRQFEKGVQGKVVLVS